MTDVTIAEGFAERICGTTYEDFPADALHWARVQILDTFGVALAGSVERVSGSLTWSRPPERPRAHVICSGQRGAHPSLTRP
jgi:2-methylcitrate dehydratase PrpD